MAKRLFLPLSPTKADQLPTVDAVRKRLGGRAGTEPGAGEVVSFRDDRGFERTGVVLFVRGAELDVWAAGDLVRRLRREETRAADGALEAKVFEVSRDACTFAALAEGDRVRFEHASGPGEGRLVEKCRFGALVERGDGTVLGVGFRRLQGA
jgi:hypothetical protein